jgi:hypothetical protein
MPNLAHRCHSGAIHPIRFGGGAKAHTVAEEMAEGAARIGQRRFSRSPWIEPGALNAGDDAVEIGHGSK